MFRNNNWKDKDGVFLIEEGECCKASAPYENTPSICVTANWWTALDRKNSWAVCPNGYFMQGLYRGGCHWLWCIEEAKCCKPVLLPYKYGHCFDEDVGASFDKKGLSRCPPGYHMAGIYRGGCDKLYCLEKFKCCREYDGCNMAHWRQAFDDAGWVQCDSSTQYLTGLFRNRNLRSNDKIDLLEEGRCCSAPTLYKNTPSTCLTANWWSALDHNNNWAVCPAGYFMHGMYRGNCRWLYCIEEAKCCKPNSLPNQYGHCYDDTAVATTFDHKGLTKCKDGYYMVGIFRGGCDKLYCIERFRCCKMYEDVNECQTIQPCKNGATCVNLIGNYRCDCTAAYTGTNCDVDVNECSDASLCQNGATCVNMRGSYQCNCAPGYAGNNCETDVNECSGSSLCKNGATCVNLPGSYRCNCVTGYTGNNCDSDVNECSDASLCKNGATCVNEPGSYRCHCTTGYTGNNCESDVDECSDSSLCKNGATCVNEPGSYRCNCVTGYTGNKCESDVDECTNVSQCQNGGTCSTLKGSYQCDCPTEYTGNRCQTDVDECTDVSVCRNGGTCVNVSSGYRCDCVSGYEGNNCETSTNEVDECQLII